MFCPNIGLALSLEVTDGKNLLGLSAHGGTQVPGCVELQNRGLQVRFLPGLFVIRCAHAVQSRDEVALRVRFLP